MENAENFRCNFCVYTSDTFRKFRNHYVRYHRNDPNFSVTCCIDSCAYTTKKWGSYKVHVHRKHKEYDEPRAVNYNDPRFNENVGDGDDHDDVEEGLYYTKNPCYEFVITMVLLQIIARTRKYLILRRDQKLLLFVNITQPCI